MSLLRSSVRPHVNGMRDGLAWRGEHGDEWVWLWLTHC